MTGPTSDPLAMELHADVTQTVQLWCPRCSSYVGEVTDLSDALRTATVHLQVGHG